MLYEKYRIADELFKEFVSEGIPGSNNKESCALLSSPSIYHLF